MNTGLLTVISMSTFGVFKNINQSSIFPKCEDASFFLNTYIYFASSLVPRCNWLTKLIIYSELFGADPHPENKKEEKVCHKSSPVKNCEFQCGTAAHIRAKQ